MNRKIKLVLLAIGTGTLGMLLSVGASLVLTYLVQPSNDTLGVFWENKLQLVPVALGFGIQVGMYTALRKGMHRSMSVPAGRTTTATSGSLSTVAMVACCAPAGLNLLPLLGITAITNLLASWKMPFMVASVAVNVIGFGVMSYTVIRQWRVQRRARPGQPQPALF